MSFLGSRRTMTSSDSLEETVSLSHTPNPAPDPPHEAPGPGFTIAVLEISSPSPFCWGSLPSPKINHHPILGPLTTQKIQDLLRDLRDVIQSTGHCGGVTEATESSEETKISEDGPEHQEKAGKLHEADTVVSENLLICLGIEKKQGTENQGLTLENKNPKNMELFSARNWEQCSEGETAPTRAQLSKGGREERSLVVQEENIKLRKDMEQLLQEAEHWSRQHLELSALIRSYQQSHRDSGVALDGCWAQLQSQPHSWTCPEQTLQGAVRSLHQDMHTLHLIAALLENECQILQQRVQTLEEPQQPHGGPCPEKPPQRSYLQARNGQALTKLELLESSRQNFPVLGGAFQKKGWVCRISDPCLNKKAHNNQFNTRIAKALMEGKRPASGFS